MVLYNSAYTSSANGFATNKVLAEGTEERQGETGYQIIETHRVENILKDTAYIAIVAAVGSLTGTTYSDPLNFAINLPNVNPSLYPGNLIRGIMPKRGDAVGQIINIDSANNFTLHNIYVLDVKAQHPTKSIDSALVMVTYGELGKSFTIPNNGDTTSTHTMGWLIGGAINGTTVNINTSFTVGTDNSFNHPALVYYKPNSPHYDWVADSTNSTFTGMVASGSIYGQYASLASLENLSNVIYKTRMIFNPNNSTNHLDSAQSIQAAYDGAVNSVAIWGRAVGTIRLRLTVGEFDSLRSLQILDPITNDGVTRRTLWDMGFNFEWRERGWAELETFQWPTTGHEPADVDDPSDGTYGIPAGKTHGNGWGLFPTVKSADFTKLALPDLRTV